MPRATFPEREEPASSPSAQSGVQRVEDTAIEDYRGVNLRDFIRDAAKLLWAPPHVRRILHAHKLNLVPANVYSEVPTVDEIESCFETKLKPAPYYSPELFDRYTLAAFLDFLKPYSVEFDPLVDPPPCTGFPHFFWRNPAFSYSDAMAYYCIVRAFKPRRIMEIGSGFSTLVANDAILKNGVGEILVIDPLPSETVCKLETVTKLVHKPIQDVPIADLLEDVQTCDILFIDSTHTVKMGSDCLQIYLRLLPQISHKILVHSHDIFLPFGLRIDPALHSHIYWTEQYLLLALLLDNPKASVKFGSHYHLIFNKRELDALMWKRYPSGGGSFWYELDPDKLLGRTSDGQPPKSSSIPVLSSRL